MSVAPLDPGHFQRQAADRTHSVWVAASAGSGKTKVLTDRVLNLLLGGTAPGRILCLTFTKAAAAEMSNRLNKRLSEWAVAADMELNNQIHDITGQRPDADLLAAARRLFARVLDTPGGMRILTIHSFCQSVLRRFPLEAGIAPQFEVMDDRAAAELLAEAQARVLNRAREEAEHGDTGPATLAGALAEVTSRIHETGFAELMAALALERGRLARLLDAAGGLEPYLRRVRRTLGLRPDEDATSCREALCAPASLDEPMLRRAARALAGSKAVTDQRMAEGLALWLAADLAGRGGGFDAYAALFLTQKGDPRARLATKGVLDANPAIGEALLAEQARIAAGRELLAACDAAAATAALTRLAAAFLASYEKEKTQRSLVDYDDLILMTRDLLARPGVAPWVLFKLDGGLDHILIDEAQDTNPDQWQVVAALAEEFFVGEGAREPGRTIFAVGDAKQSIFSFQRADPQHFIAMREHFAGRVAAAQENWRDVPLAVSFRSTDAVLALVDAVFARDTAKDGVAIDGNPIEHRAFRAGHAGRVELWPPIEPLDAEMPEPWAPPVEQRNIDQPRARLATLIARTIAHWTARGEILPSKGRPIRPGDVLVLVRRRGAFVAELVRALKAANVPVAGTDRMVLTRQIAVMDLVALGRFLLLPEDDLTLATVLKSPLIGFDEDRLYDVAQGRTGRLWQALRHHPAPWAAEAASLLGDLLARADYVPPHELYAALLGPGGGRRRLIARLGHEAEDAIDEFVTQTLAYEGTHVPSLEGFLHWLESGESEVKRDLDQGGRDEVRIMTVHGAKGLQAPIVILPDTFAVPAQVPPLLWSEEADAPMLWAPGAGGAAPAAAQAKARAVRRRDQEYRRLLYVALTRAEDRLHVAGWKTRRSGGGECWYDLVQGGMATLTGNVQTTIDVPPDAESFVGDGMVYATRQTAEPKRDSGVATEATASAPLPAFARAAAPIEPAPPRPLIASRPSEPEPAPRSPLGTETDQRRFQRGLLIHRLMQTLPELPRAQAEAAARRFLARPAHGLEPERQDAIARETLSVLEDPRFGALFGPGSRAEVPIVGLVDGKALSARVDRLVVTEDSVLVVDYKTNRPPPTLAADVAPAYREQLAAYRAALERIYPGKEVRTLLLWTDGPSLMEITPQP